VASKDDNKPPIIIKKVKKGGHGGHHGGAWKVAYADFVTAMMAFFLLLWLINATTPEQRRGIAQFFTPDAVSRSSVGSGGILGGQTVSPGELPRTTGGVVLSVPVMPSGETQEVERDPAENGDSGEQTAEGPAPGTAPATQPGMQPGTQPGEQPGDQPNTQPNNAQIAGEPRDQAGNPAGQTRDPTAAELHQAAREREEQEFQRAEQELRQAIQDIPDLRNLAQNLIIDRTPEGLRIQLVDQERASMFPLGSANPNDNLRRLFGTIAQVVQRMPNRISVTGHTDATPYTRANYSNWELSTDRANSSRRGLIDAGVPATRISYVVGKAEQEPLISDNPFDPRNRRISIVLLRQAPVQVGQATR
jgi:chemotaxis protein MotB